MERLEQYDTFAIHSSLIYYDPDFNCRSAFTLDSVKELADSIGKDGLAYPVIVQPWDQRPDYEYRLLAGHRRFKAIMTFLDWETIPANIRANLSDWEAHKLNFLENLERKDLNILEEARAIQRLFPEGASIIKVKTELQRPYYWAYIRLRLLQLPEEIQTMVAAGLLRRADIEILDRIEEGKEAQIRAAEELVRSHRERKPGRRKGFRPFQKSAKRINRVRNREEINQMVSKMLELGITGLPTRVGAWCAGHITNEELTADMEKVTHPAAN